MTRLSMSFSEQQNYTGLYTDFYLILLHVSTVYFSLHRVGIMVHKKVQRWEASPYNSGHKIIVKKYVLRDIGIGQIWGRHDCQAVVYTDSQMWLQRFVIAKVSQELTGSSFSAEKWIGLWVQSAQQSFPWHVSVPTGRVTDVYRSSFMNNPLSIPQ